MAAGSIVIDLLARTGLFETDLDRAAKRTLKFKKDVVETGKAIGTAFAAGALAGGAALAALTKSAINRMDDLSKASQRTQLPVEQFSQLAHAANLSDVALADLEGSLGRLAKAQATAADGSKATQAAFDKLGIAFKNADGTLRDSRAVFMDFADAYERFKGSPEILATGMQIFGRSFQSLIPLLKDGRQGLQDAAREADRLGLTISGEAARQAEEFNDRLTKLSGAADGLANIIAARTLPKLLEFSDLINDPETQQSLRSIATGLGDIASAAISFTQRITEAAGAYRKWLADAGRLPADMLDNAQQLDERIRKLSNMQYGGGMLNQLRRGIFGDTITEELRKAIEERNRLPWRNVTGGVTSTYDRPTVESPPQPGGGGGELRALPDFAQAARAELEALLEGEARAREQFNAWAATLEGPIAAANYRYAQDLAELNDLAKAGAIDSDSLRLAQERLAEQHDANVRALERQLTPAEEALRHLQEEAVWLSANEEALRRLAAARMLGADATQEQIDKAVELMKINEQLEDSLRAWDNLNRNIADTLFDVVTGTESAMDAIKGFFDNLNRQILSNITEDWADSITGWLKGLGRAGGGDTAFGANSFSTGGGFWSSLLGAIGFGGARAAGGDVLSDRAYLVGEQGPELFRPRTAGAILPAQETAVAMGKDSRRLPVTVNQTINVQGLMDRRSPSQIAAASMREQRRAMLRGF